jgi:uncharacterized protein YbaP (TraB family)
LVILLLVACVLVLSGNREARAQDGKSFLWKVDFQGAVVYILGSVHLLKSENYPLKSEIEKAFEEADTLVVEANIGDLKKIDPELLLAKALYPEGDSLSNHVSPETLALVKSAAERLGLPSEAVIRQKPWMLALLLSNLEMMRLGYEPRFGVDWHFLSKAGKVKRVLELESFEYQVDLFSGLPPEEQELFLLLAMQDLKNVGEQVDRLVRAWAAGDVRGMEEVLMKKLREDRRLYPFYEKFLYNRNREMVKKIDFYLKTRGIYFVVVGAAHLLGEKGIIAMLREKGYKVRQS